MADWQGTFGDQYTMRNAELADRTKFFQRFLKYEIVDAFEIGCNIGTNMKVLERLGIETIGCDVNATAVNIATLNNLKAYVATGTDVDVYNTFDLVFTVGVLIHQQTAELIKMMKEMVRLSAKYVMFAEYVGDDEEVPYRGERHALFKREFGRIFESLFPQAELLDTGTAGKEMGFDNVTYWMYDISNCSSEDGFTQVARESSDEGEREEFIGSPVGAFGKVGVS
uniref:Putative methyltransferase n=1 Tax=viral metagenome TaxID=1070528 RepID=A0A6H1ZU88_9ZZZZ